MPQLLIGSTETGDTPACAITLPDELDPAAVVALVEDVWEQQTPEGSVPAWVACDSRPIADAVADRYTITRRDPAKLATTTATEPTRPTRNEAAT
jgi:hypothetical protein